MQDMRSNKTNDGQTKSFLLSPQTHLSRGLAYLCPAYQGHPTYTENPWLSRQVKVMLIKLKKIKKERINYSSSFSSLPRTRLELLEKL